jgi:ADP-ribose pyrophosphatase
MTKDPLDPWTTLSRRIAYETPWIRIEHRDVLTPSGKPGTYGIVRFANWAIGVLPIDALGFVPLVGQWRVPMEQWSWEIPEGGGPKDQSPEASARRELKEETGYTAGRLQEILRLQLSNSVTDEEAICFLATDLSPGEAEPEDTEVLQHRTLHFSALLAAVVAGDITDSLTVACVYRAYHMATTGAIDAALARVMLTPPHEERADG